MIMSDTVLSANMLVCMYRAVEIGERYAMYREKSKNIVFASLLIYILHGIFIYNYRFSFL